MRAFFCVLIASVAAACGAPQQPAEAPATEQISSMRLQVLDTWASPTPGGVDVSAGYLTIANDGDSADQLIAASSPRAARVEIHEMTMDGAVMQMRPVTALAIGPGERIELAPGGRHLMFFGVTQPFAIGEEIPVQLTFEHAGVMDVALPVRTGATQGQH
jgi:periplasmic copper chaperone A